MFNRLDMKTCIDKGGKMTQRFFFFLICALFQADYFTCIATIVFLRKENCLYQACPSQDCNKKVVDQQNGMFRCEKCDKEFPNFKYRLILSVREPTQPPTPTPLPKFLADMTDFERGKPRIRPEPLQSKCTARARMLNPELVSAINLLRAIGLQLGRILRISSCEMQISSFMKSLKITRKNV